MSGVVAALAVCGLAVAALAVCGLAVAALAATLLTAREELDLIDDDLELAPTLAVALPGAVTQLTFDRDLRPLGEIATHGLGAGAKHRAIHEVGVILPLAILRVATTIVNGDAKGKNLGTAGGCAQLGIAGEVSGNSNAVDAHA